MSLKDGLNNIVDGAKNALENAKDAVSEASHRSAAEGEQAKRDLAGDQMTAGEKLGSILNQGKNTVQAEVDASKREARNAT